MRMRKKPNLAPRMERCAALLEGDPASLRGRWLNGRPGLTALHLELGCGKGRFTVETAAANPQVLLAAGEPVPDAMVVAMERALERELTNVRFLDADAVRCPELFAPGEVERIYVNFPDPWRKKKQFKRRLTAPSFLKSYADILSPDGELWFKTDDRPLFDWSVEQLEVCGWTVTALTNDLHRDGPVGVMTDYEAKFHAQGVPINRLTARPPRAAGEEAQNG